MDYFHLNDKTKIRTNCRFPTQIKYEVDILKRDMGKVLDAGTRLKDDRQSIIEIGYVSEPDKDNWEQ
ncbi:hypothetical protein, partial [Acinetobacter baumannii]|uniref:hypothetical protein n=1 Tax=Acinetobacter baumannii TaxID=470 RepID=UPI003390A59F